MKSILNKARELFQYCPGDMCKFRARNLAIELAEYVQRWIPIDEELPDSIDVVIGKTKDDAIITCCYHSESNKWYMMGTALELKITHWRPVTLS